MYDYTNRNLVKMTLKLNQMNCNNFNPFSAKPMFGANIVGVFILAAISLALTLNYFFSIAKMYRGIRQKYIEKEKELKNRNLKLSLRKIKTKNQKYISKMTKAIKKEDHFGELSLKQAEKLAENTAMKTRWEDLRYSEKAKLFSYWSIIILISNILQMTGAVMCLYRDYVGLSSLQLFVGLGTFFCWVSVTKYIEHSPSISFFSRTIQHAGPNIVRHAINMLPFWIGFAMLGLSVFWASFRFRDPSIAFFSLFCIMNGDEISNTFQEVMQFDMVFGAIFVFCWVVFSMSVMMNLFMIIVGDSFEAIQETHKFNWLTDVGIPLSNLINFVGACH